MAEEIIRRDENNVPVSGAVSNDASLEVRNIRVDPSTNALITSGTSTVSGTVTANAGTDLNTSALALESGGNLAAIAASASILDDWDESDRAKVNLIVGQAGIAAGTGVDGVTVPRVSLATNVALPAGTNALGTVAPTLTARSFADSTVSVDAASETVLASNGSRKSLYITNTSTSARVSLNITDAAVLDQGITLLPGATWQMTDFDFTTAQINGIASAGATVVSVMEIT